MIRPFCQATFYLSQNKNRREKNGEINTLGFWDIDGIFPSAGVGLGVDIFLLGNIKCGEVAEFMERGQFPQFKETEENTNKAK